MSYHVEKGTGDLVIDGWQNGVAQAPELGIADMRCVNLVTFPGEVCVGFSATQSSPSAITAGSVVSASGNVITWANTATLTNGIAITFTGASLPVNIVAGTVYWVGSVSGATFSIYTDPLLASIFVLGGTGTGTFSTVNMQEPKYYANQPTYTAPSQTTWTYLVDSVGAVWFMGTAFSTWRFMGNDLTRTGSNGNGLVYYQSKTGSAYLFTFRNNKIDYIPVATAGGGAVTFAVASWQYDWQTLNTAAGTNIPHEALWSFQDNTVYYCDGYFIGSFYENTAGGSTFDPANGGTYTINLKALFLPQNDNATCLSILGNNLLIGGVRNLIYPWDRLPIVVSGTTPSLIYGFSLPIFLSESYVTKMVTVNTNTYIFAGFRGRIYVTNGTQAQLFTKVPDSIGQTPDPIYTWKTAGSFRNQIYFGFLYSPSANVQPNNPLYGGVWSVDVTNAANTITFPTAEALRITQIPSFGNYSGYVSLIIVSADNGAGGGFSFGWADGNGNFGTDIVGSGTYSGYQTYIDTDIIPIGTALLPKTPSQIEFKLNSELLSGEGIKISARTDLTSGNSSQSFALIGENITPGAISQAFTSNFEKAQWVQFRVAMKSPGNASGDSFVRLTQLRMR